jgi:hypothetical protein
VPKAFRTLLLPGENSQAAFPSKIWQKKAGLAISPLLMILDFGFRFIDFTAIRSHTYK